MPQEEKGETLGDTPRDKLGKGEAVALPKTLA